MLPVFKPRITIWFPNTYTISLRQHNHHWTLMQNGSPYVVHLSWSRETHILFPYRNACTHLQSWKNMLEQFLMCNICLSPISMLRHVHVSSCLPKYNNIEWWWGGRVHHSYNRCLFTYNPNARHVTSKKTFRYRNLQLFDRIYLCVCFFNFFLIFSLFLRKKIWCGQSKLWGRWTWTQLFSGLDSDFTFASNVRFTVLSSWIERCNFQCQHKVCKKKAHLAKVLNLHKISCTQQTLLSEMLPKVIIKSLFTKMAW